MPNQRRNRRKFRRSCFSRRGADIISVQLWKSWFVPYISLDGFQYKCQNCLGHGSNDQVHFKFGNGPSLCRYHCQQDFGMQPSPHDVHCEQYSAPQWHWYSTEHAKGGNQRGQWLCCRNVSDRLWQGNHAWHLRQNGGRENPNHHAANSFGCGVVFAHAAVFALLAHHWRVPGLHLRRRYGPHGRCAGAWLEKLQASCDILLPGR